VAYRAITCVPIVHETLMRTLFDGLAHIRPRTLLYVAIGLMVLALTAQRSFYPHDHWTFWIFRASFRHLQHQQDLYARYGKHDLFKYSPTAAMLFAPFAFPPFALALLLWNAVNAGALVFAIKRISRDRDVVLALLLVLPELFVTLQASQCNALIAALIVLSFVALERGHQVRGFLAIAIGFVIKIFPIAGLGFAIFHPRRVRGAVVFAMCTLGLLLLPLLVTSPSMLLAQYEWWHQVEASDALLRGSSVMRILQQTWGITWANWTVQVAGVLVLLLPLLHHERWGDQQFRRAFLASLLVFVVIFNHQAERPSYVIAATGVAIWFADSPREPYRLLLVLLSLAGLRAWGYLPVWIVMQLELHGVALESMLLGNRQRRLKMPVVVTAVETHSLADATRSERSRRSLA